MVTDTRHSKRIALAAVLGAAILAAAPAAWAQSYYLDLHVGYNLVDDGDFEDPATTTASYEQRPAFGGSFGFIGHDGFRIEGELSWRGNDLDTLAGGPADGRLSSLGVMVNLLYELQIGGGGYGGGFGGGASPLRPYIGIGGGGARYDLEVVQTLGAAPVVDDQVYALGYQGIIGVGVDISEKAVMTLDYRYLVAENVGFTDSGGAPFEIDLVQSTVMLGLRTAF